jgi:hypothetical protein
MNGPAPARRISPWGAAVALSAVLVVGAAAALLIATVASSRERAVRFAVSGSLSGVSLDVGDADVEIAGGNRVGAAGRRPLLEVERTDRFAFGHDAVVSRSLAMGELRLRSRCPKAVPHACSSRYRLVVPDNVPVDVRASGGTVRLRGYRGSARVTTRSGDIVVSGFCGFSLQARAESGDIATSVACAPQQLTLRSTAGSVTAAVPPGRYQVEAESTNGAERVSGIAAVDDAPFSIQALSSSGDVVVEGRR